LSTAGQILAMTDERHPPLPPNEIASAAAIPTYASNNQMRRLASDDQHGPDRYRIVVWISMQSLALESTRLQQAFWLGVPVALALASFGGSIIAKHALRPLDEALRMQREFMADASHQLRTPVSVVRTAAQV